MISESLRVELCDWLRANSIDPNDVPYAAPPPRILDGRIEITVFLRDADGKRQVSPTEVNRHATAVVGVPLITRPSPALSQWIGGNPWWLVWSNQKGMWWRPDHTGYTQFIEEAGRYTHAEALKIVAQATCDGQLQHHRVNPYTGVEYIGLDEIAVLAPEASP